MIAARYYKVKLENSLNSPKGSSAQIRVDVIGGSGPSPARLSQDESRRVKILPIEWALSTREKDPSHVKIVKTIRDAR